MRERLEQLLPDVWPELPIFTFHSLGLSMLQEHWNAAGLQRGFRIAAEAERLGFLQDALSVSEQQARRLLSAISRLKRTQSDPEDVKLAEALRVYQEALEHHNLVDYDDLIGRAAELLAAEPGSKRPIGSAIAGSALTNTRMSMSNKCVSSSTWCRLVAMSVLSATRIKPSTAFEAPMSTIFNNLKRILPPHRSCVSPATTAPTATSSRFPPKSLRPRVPSSARWRFSPMTPVWSRSTKRPPSGPRPSLWCKRSNNSSVAIAFFPSIAVAPPQMACKICPSPTLPFSTAPRLKPRPSLKPLPAPACRFKNALTPS